MAGKGADLRLPPHSKEAEASVLGGIMLRNEALHEAGEFLTPEDFYLPAHSVIFQAMLELDQRGVPIDPLSVEQQLKSDGNLELVGGLDDLTELSSRVPTSENIHHYIQIVQDKSKLRKMIRVASEVVSEAFAEPADVDEFFDEAEKKFFDVSQSKVDTSFVHIRPIIDEIVRRIQTFSENPQMGEITGVPTGFEGLDRITGGLQPGALNILAARPALGKTSLALNMASYAAMEHGMPVLILSLEMTATELVERIICSEARVNNRDLRKHRIDRDEWVKVTDAMSEFFNAPIYINDTANMNIMTVRNKCRRFRANREIFKEKDQLGLIVVDYLQLMRAPSGRRMEAREREIAEISRGLKAVAKEVGLPVLAVSQLNRELEKREDKRPRMSDLRESGAIEQDADLIMFLHRESAYKTKKHADDDSMEEDNSAELIVAKHRHGSTGTVELVFLGQYTRFENVTNQEPPPGF